GVIGSSLPGTGKPSKSTPFGTTQSSYLRNGAAQKVTWPALKDTATARNEHTLLSINDSGSPMAVTSSMSSIVMAKAERLIHPVGQISFLRFLWIIRSSSRSVGRL